MPTFPDASVCFRQVCRVGGVPIRHLPLLPTPEQVGKMGQAIHQHLCAIQMPQAKDSALRVITLLARNHIPELVAAFLDFSTPLDRYLAVSSSLTPLLRAAASTSCPPITAHRKPRMLGVGRSQHLCSLSHDPFGIPHETSAPASTTQSKCSLIPECSYQDPHNHRASPFISVAPSALLSSSFSSSLLF